MVDAGPYRAELILFKKLDQTLGAEINAHLRSRPTCSLMDIIKLAIELDVPLRTMFRFVEGTREEGCIVPVGTFSLREKELREAHRAERNTSRSNQSRS